MSAPPVLSLPWGLAYLPAGRDSVVLVSLADGRAIEVPLATLRVIAEWIESHHD